MNLVENVSPHCVGIHMALLNHKISILTIYHNRVNIDMLHSDNLKLALISKNKTSNYILFYDRLCCCPFSSSLCLGSNGF